MLAVKASELEQYILHHDNARPPAATATTRNYPKTHFCASSSSILLSRFGTKWLPRFWLTEKSTAGSSVRKKWRRQTSGAYLALRPPKAFFSDRINDKKLVECCDKCLDKQEDYVWYHNYVTSTYIFLIKNKSPLLFNFLSYNRTN